MGNNAPKTKWVGHTMSCGTFRQRLYVDGFETPYFIDSARGIRAHKSQGEEHGLYGSGMYECKAPGRDGEKRYIAAPLGSSQKISSLKHRAEQMALAQ